MKLGFFILSEISGSEEEEWKEIRVLNQCAIHPLTNEKIPILVIVNKIEDRSENNAILGIPEADSKHKIIAEKVKIENEIGTGQKLDREEMMEKLRNLKIGGYWTSSRLKDWLISR